MVESTTDPIPGIHWLSDAEYSQAVGQFRLQLNGVLKVFNLYGQGIYIPQAVFEITRLTEDFGLRVRGVDKIIALDSVRNGARQEG